MTDLKPCPFCGGSNLSTGGNDHIVGVWCDDCQASGPNHYGRHEWNTRAEPDPEAIVKAALERAADYLFMFAEPGVSLDYSLEDEIKAIRSIASDPAEVAQIIKTAGEDRG